MCLFLHRELNGSDRAAAAAGFFSTFKSGRLVGACGRVRLFRQSGPGLHGFQMIEEYNGEFETSVVNGK